MNFKSYLIEKNYSQISKIKAILFYGENIGLKKHFKRLIRTYNKEVKIITFLQDDILNDENVLFNELNNLSLFEEKKILFIENANDKIFKILESYLDSNLNFQLFFFSDILEKKSKLRNYFEKSRIYGSIPCYADTSITIQRIVQDELKNFQGLTSVNLNIILESCNNDRIKVYNEINKIITFFETNGKPGDSCYIDNEHESLVFYTGMKGIARDAIKAQDRPNWIVLRGDYRNVITGDSSSKIAQNLRAILNNNHYSKITLNAPPIRVNNTYDIQIHLFHSPSSVDKIILYKLAEH